MNENMPIRSKIFTNFWDRHHARFPQKIQSTETYTNDATQRSGFPAKTRSVAYAILN